MDRLDDLRKKYISTDPPQSLGKGWSGIEEKLGAQETPSSFTTHYIGTLALSFLLLSLLIVGAAKASKPGDKLYPLKIITDKAEAKITRNPELKIERRAEDIIRVSDDPKRLDDAIIRYQKTVKEATQEVKPTKANKLQQTLQRQEEKFKVQAKFHPALSEKLDEIIKVEQRVEGQVEGVENDDRRQEKGKVKNSHNTNLKKN